MTRLVAVAVLALVLSGCNVVNDQLLTQTLSIVSGQVLAEFTSNSDAMLLEQARYQAAKNRAADNCIGKVEDDSDMKATDVAAAYEPCLEILRKDMTEGIWEKLTGLFRDDEPDEPVGQPEVAGD